MTSATASTSPTTIIHRILCPIDFSETSVKAFEYAAKLARHLRAELVLLHAFDTPETLNIAGQTHPLNHELQTKLEAFQAPSADVAISRTLHAGDAGEVICWLAEQRGCDLIVMGTHGRSGLKHLLFGSVAEHVLRHARCPVLTVRDRPADERPLPEPLVIPLPPPRLL